MNSNRGKFNSTPMFSMKQQKKKSTSEAGSPAPVQRSEEKRFSVLSVVLVAVLPALFLAAADFLPIFWYAHFYPKIRKKYHLERLFRS